MKMDSKFSPAIPAALIPFVAPLASFAAEGTGRVIMIIIYYHYYLYKGFWN